MLGGCWSCSQPLCPCPSSCSLHHTALHQGQSHLFIHSSRGSPAPSSPRQPPFTSREGGHWLPSARLGKSPPGAAESSLWSAPHPRSRSMDLLLLYTIAGLGISELEGELSSEKTLPTPVSIYSNMECCGGGVPGLLRGGSRLGRAASHRVRTGGGRCSRWPRRRARSLGAGTSRRPRPWRCPRLSLGSPARCWQSPWQR